MLLERYLKKQLDSFPEHLRGSLKDVPTMRMMATCDHLIITSSGFFFSGTPILGSYFGMQDQTLETKQHVLQVAGSLSARTKHPLFKAIALAASENGLPVREIDTDSLGSTGIVGKLDRTWYVMGDEKVMHDEGIE
ncbi:MAG: hypothetical protein K0S20_67, partial [Patescibacteria group bacterium]|nr:hypothetical protein [Patescibacteria group bacterium]